MTLKVGDRVKVRDDRNYLARYGLGRIVAVPSVDHVEVLFDGKRYPAGCAKTPGAGTHSPSLFEKIEEPTPKFKVGDRVLDRAYSKEVVTVTSTNANPTWPIQARYPDGGLGLWKESELEKVESVPFKLERGDKVVNRKTGRVGFVLGGWVHDDNEPIREPATVKAIEEYEEHHPGTYDLIKKDAPW